MNFFQYEDYRQLLEDIIETRKDIRGMKSRLAEAAGCQRSYFSQVMRGNSSLTLEQGIGISNYLHWSEIQTMYFLDLLQWEKAGTPILKEYYLQRLKSLRKKSREVSSRIGEKGAIPDNFHGQYYSSWMYSAVHILVGIKTYQRPSEIGKRLDLPIEIVIQVLESLEKMSLVKRTDMDKWMLTEKSVHLEKSSPMSFANHGNWRQQGLFDVYKQKESSVHYTAVQSLSKKDIETFRSFVLDMIEKSRDIVRQSGAEEVTCFTCDFFEV